LINHLSLEERVHIGKGREEAIKQRLREAGFLVGDVDDHTDIHKKLDCYFGDDQELSQIKTRDNDSGSDVLIDVYEPYYGLYDPRTKPARDVRSKYAYYIVLSRGTIYVIKGTSQKPIVEAVLEEWKAQGCRLPFYSDEFVDDQGHCVQLRRHIDAQNKRPKVLMFIPPTIYSADDIVSTIQMVGKKKAA
jgi:hypothetical protein